MGLRKIMQKLYEPLDFQKRAEQELVQRFTLRFGAMLESGHYPEEKLVLAANDALGSKYRCTSCKDAIAYIDEVVMALRKGFPKLHQQYGYDVYKKGRVGVL